MAKHQKSLATVAPRKTHKYTSSALIFSLAHALLGMAAFAASILTLVNVLFDSLAGQSTPAQIVKPFLFAVIGMSFAMLWLLPHANLFVPVRVGPDGVHVRVYLHLDPWIHIPWDQIIHLEKTRLILTGIGPASYLIVKDATFWHRLLGNFFTGTWQSINLLGPGLDDREELERVVESQLTKI